MFANIDWKALAIVLAVISVPTALGKAVTWWAARREAKANRRTLRAVQTHRQEEYKRRGYTFPPDAA